MPAAYLQIPGIKGVSADAQFKDWIPVESYQLHTRGQAGGGVGSARPAITDAILTKLSDMSSPSIQQAAVKGTHFASILLRVVRPSADGYSPPMRQTVEFKDAYITGWQVSGSPGDKAPVESFSLNFLEFSMLVEADPDAQRPPGPAVTFHYQNQNKQRGTPVRRGK
jgi:type VI protein secretion system component Hcp